MTRDPIFRALPPHVLPQLATALTYDPAVSGSASGFLSKLSQPEQTQWLDAHRNDLEDHMSFVGSSFLSYMTGNGKSYRQTVLDTAEKLQTSYGANDSTAQVEQNIIRKFWNDTVERMTPEQRQELFVQTEALAAKYGVTLGKEMAGFASLTAAQMSGFGVYLLGSTLLGAINGALGLGLGFGVFTGLSSLVSTVIGPIGWATLGLFTLAKLGRPNYKKLLPAIILISVSRSADSVERVHAQVSEGKEPVSAKGVVLLPVAKPAGGANERPGKRGAEAAEAELLQRALAAFGAEIAKTRGPSQSIETPRTADYDRGERSQTRQPSLPANPVIRELQWDVEQATKRTRAKAKKEHKPTVVRQYICSKQDKTIFDLKNRDLASFTRTLAPETHYLDLQGEQKAEVDALFAQYKEKQEEDARERERLEQFRKANQKREHRLRHRGKTERLDEVRKANFDHEFPDLARIAMEWDPNRHYLELSAEEQAFIKAWEVNEGSRAPRDTAARERLRELENDYAASPRSKPGVPEPDREGQSARKAVARLRHDYASLLPNHSFSDSALARLDAMEDGKRKVFLDQLRLMHDGKTNAKHEVPGTSPKLWQLDAGNDGKVYYRRDGVNKFVVELIGLKKQQDADYACLQRKSTN
jgi:uncharacterized protein YaaW (UPF0174 family)